MTPGKPLEAGDRVLLLDDRGRRFLVTLQAGGTFHHHGGAVAHDDIIGSEEGTTVRSMAGKTLACFRPRLSDFVLKMGRGAQVIYPKDLGAILMHADVGPGDRVLEAGTGSGALAIALCRAVGPGGRVVSYEIRPSFHDIAAANVEAFFGELPDWLELRRGDVAEVANTAERFDRVLLDLPEPWSVLPEVAASIRPGGIVCAYLPTTGQVQSLVAWLREGAFADVQTFEVMLRTWHVTGRSVRPDHRMVGHTGFITVARRTTT